MKIGRREGTMKIGRRDDDRKEVKGRSKKDAEEDKMSFPN